MRQEAVAKRYARALYFSSQKAGREEALARELSQFQDLMATSPEAQRLFAAPVFNALQRHAVLDALFKKITVTPELQRFLNLLAENGRLSCLREICEQYRKIWDEAQGVVNAQATGAERLSDEFVRDLEQRLSTISGRKVKVSAQQDPGVLAGVVVRMGDKVFDGSLKTQLQKMKERFVS